MAAAPDVSKQGTRQERDRLTRPFSTAPIVLKAADVSGDKAVDLILKIRDALEASGDSQTPIINFATEDELATDADSEL